jgi:hypothetical protein
MREMSHRNKDPERGEADGFFNETICRLPFVPQVSSCRVIEPIRVQFLSHADRLEIGTQ